MPRKKFIDKKSAQTFALVHRAQNDPLIHDVSASSMVFKEVAAPNARRIKTRADLDAEFAASGVRANEGEAANYGVFYDDSQYDYMQHMRDLGQNTDAQWVEPAAGKNKGKRKVRLEDALREISLDDARSEGGVSLASSTARSLLPDEMLPSEFVQKRTYQDQQDVPDALAGFQPDMDPRLREVLEALEDEAYVDDDEQDDFFKELAGKGEEVDRDEWEAAEWEDGDGDGGWETDDTIKPEDEVKQSNDTSNISESNIPAAESQATATDSQDHGDGAWLAEFSKFKKDAKAGKASTPALAPSDFQSSILTGTSALTNGRRKKRKGALTSSTGYSMTSSALFRTEGLSLLDARFDKIEEEYAESGYGGDVDDSASVASGTSGMSGVSRMSGVSKMSGVSAASSEAPALRADFDAIMDDFLGGYSMSGKRRVKKGGKQTGMEQLEEIRRGLGPARIRSQRV